MAPKIMAYVDKKGRPVTVVLIQLAFGCLAFINLASDGGVIFTWLLSLSGLSILFVYGSIGLSHVRFRKAWIAQGHSLDELPFKAAFGVWGSYFAILVCVAGLLGQFYVALYPIGGPNLDAKTFFELYLAGPFLIGLYLMWKIYSWFVRPEDRPIWTKIKDIDIYSGMRETQRMISGAHLSEEQRRAALLENPHDVPLKRTPKEYLMASIRSII